MTLEIVLLIVNTMLMVGNFYLLGKIRGLHEASGKNIERAGTLLGRVSRVQKTSESAIKEAEKETSK